MAKLSPSPIFRAFDDNGDPLSGGKLFTYDAGTTTKKVTYTDSNEVTPNTNPIILDANGEADVWLADGAYKFVLSPSTDTDPPSSPLWTVDNIVGDTESAFGSAFVTTSGNLNITSSLENNIIICTAALTLSLLTASNAGEGFYFLVKNTGSGDVTLDPDGSETINGAATKVLRPGQSVSVNCSGIEWFTFFEDGILADDNTFTGDNIFEGDVDLPNGVVDYANIQNVADYRVLGNVSGSPAAPSEVQILDEDDMASDSATALATQQSIKKYVDDTVNSSLLGVGQTWTDVTASRSSGVTYTNSTGRPIVVQVRGENSNFILISASIDGGSSIVVGTGNRSSGTTGGAGNIIVQPGSTYSLSIPGLTEWWELR